MLLILIRRVGGDIGNCARDYASWISDGSASLVSAASPPRSPSSPPQPASGLLRYVPVSPFVAHPPWSWGFSLFLFLTSRLPPSSFGLSRTTGYLRGSNSLHQHWSRTPCGFFYGRS